MRSLKVLLRRFVGIADIGQRSDEEPPQRQDHQHCQGSGGPDDGHSEHELRGGLAWIKSATIAVIVGPTTANDHGSSLVA